MTYSKVGECAEMNSGIKTMERRYWSPEAGSRIIWMSLLNFRKMEATMRFASFVEGLLFTIGFLFLCLMILFERPAQPAPVKVAAKQNRRRPPALFR